MSQKKAGERGHLIGFSRPSDEASLGLLAKKKPLNFRRMNPQFRRPHRYLCKKALILYRNQPAVRSSSCFFFSKKPSNFTKINPQSSPFKWAGLPPVRAYISPDFGLTEPNSAQSNKTKNANPSLLNSTQLPLHWKHIPSHLLVYFFLLLTWIYIYLQFSKNN
jgi:hypothetical protein